MRSVIAVISVSVSVAWPAPQKEELPAGALARLGAIVTPVKEASPTGEVNSLLFLDDNVLFSGSNSGWTTWDVQKRQTRQASPSAHPPS